MWRLGLLMLTGCATASVRPAADPPARIPLAVTLDDLPFAGPTPRDVSVDVALERIVTILRGRRVPATGFVVCHGLEGEEAALTRWFSAGLDVANHSTSHRDIDALEPEAWTEDVRGCRDRLGALTGTKPHYFRYPMLHTSRTRQRRDAGFETLRSLGHVRAPVSIDTGEWLLATPYAEALTAGDQSRADEIADAYVSHIRLAARHYRRVARRRVGREIAQVLLLHANALAVDHLDRVLAMLIEEGFEFVPLSTALADPVYAMPDEWVDPVGASWLLRIPPVDLAGWSWDRAQLRAMEHRFGLREEDPEGTRIGRDLIAKRIMNTRAWLVTQTKPIAANSLVYVTKGGAAIIADTPWTPAATEELIDWVTLRFGQRPALATVSHWHFDASGGIGALRAAKIPVVASRETARLIQARGPSMQANLAKQHGEAFMGWSVDPPDQLFEPEAGFVTTVDGTAVQVMFPGAAHSSDNVVTWFPDDGLLFGGCMVKGGDSLGYLGDANLETYAGALEKLEALGATMVVSGHGARIDPEQLANTRRLLDRETTPRPEHDSPPILDDSAISF